MSDHVQENGDSPELEALFDTLSHKQAAQAAAPAAPVMPPPVGVGDGSGDSAELEALFESVARTAALETPPVTVKPFGDNGDSDELQALFDSLAAAAPEPEVFDSPIEHYRLRAEFRLWREAGERHYAMFEAGDKHTPILIEQFPIASAAINALMPPLKAAWQASSALSFKLFQVEFLTTLAGDGLITLCYHRPLDDNWQKAADDLHMGRLLGDEVVCLVNRDHPAVRRGWDQAATDEVCQRIEAALNEAAQQAGCKVHPERIWQVSRVPFDQRLREMVRETSLELGLPCLEMVSGASHDMIYIAQVAPGAMIFVPSMGGRSHAEVENTDWKDCAAGTDVLLQCLMRTGNEPG